MNFCPIQASAKKAPSSIAIYSKEGPITYAKLNALIDNHFAVNPIFYADNSLESILNFFSLIRQNKKAFPISRREPVLPNISLEDAHPNADVLIYTSGSMGSPKIAMISLDAILYSAMHQHSLQQMEACDTYLLSLPINHVAGIAILYRTFLFGASIALDWNELNRVTHLSFVPTQLKRFLLSNIQLQTPRLKLVALGGAPIPQTLCEQAVNKGVPLFITYGMTENASQLATVPYEASKGVCFGFPLEGREVKIDQDNEIWIKGKTLFSGYLKQRAEIKNGWYRTKDLGRLGKYGLEFLGRADRMIVSGGENIFLDELESLILQLPKVNKVSVADRDCPEFGKRPTAHIQANSPLEATSLIEELESIIPRYKIPEKEDIHIVQ